MASGPKVFPKPDPGDRLAALAGRLADPAAPLPPARPAAAVAVLLTAAPESVLLIKRAEHSGDRWSGQLAFPGGRAAPEDPDLLATARRETAEEVGIALEAGRLLGALPDLAPRTPVLPPIVVRPFVFLLPARPVPAVNHEVAAAWWLPLDTFRAPGIYRPAESRRYGTLVRTPGYHLEMGLLWGMSERILTPLLALIAPPPPSA